MQTVFKNNKYLSIKVLEVGKFYILAENSSGDYVSLVVYLGRDNKDYLFYNIMYFNTKLVNDNIYLVSKKQIEFIPAMIEEVMSQKLSFNNIVVTRTVHNKMLGIVDYEYPNIKLWYMKQRLVEPKLKELSADVHRQKYVSPSKIKVGNFYYNSSYVYYILKHEKDNLKQWKTTYMYMSHININALINKVGLNDKRAFLTEMSKKSSVIERQLDSVKEITRDAEEESLRGLSVFCKYE